MSSFTFQLGHEIGGGQSSPNTLPRLQERPLQELLVVGLLVVVGDAVLRIRTTRAEPPEARLDQGEHAPCVILVEARPLAFAAGHVDRRAVREDPSLPWSKVARPI